MLLRVAFFILMAVGLLGFGTVAWISTRPPTPAAAATAQAPVTRTVLVAARSVTAGSLLKPEDLAAKQFPVATSGLADTNADTPDIRRSLVGAMVRRSLAQGDIVHNSDVMRPGDHGFLAAVLAPGMRAVTIAVDDTSGSAGLIWPGDRVDVILTENISGQNLMPGHSVAAETVLSDARVIAIDQQLIQGAVSAPDKLAKTVTLEVTQDQAERVSVAVRLGRLSLAVRSAESSKVAAKPSSSMKTTWAVDVSPALGDAAPPPTANVVRVYQGGGEVREFRP
jgi:pilus assembly protein CpaB